MYWLFPFHDCGDILYDNCFLADTDRLGRVQTATAGPILGCLRVTSHENILDGLDVMLLRLVTLSLSHSYRIW